jgi:hypothetical protein
MSIKYLMPTLYERKRNGLDAKTCCLCKCIVADNYLQGKAKLMYADE